MSKKRKVETPSDSDPATPEGGSFTLLSQLDRAARSLTPPTPEPAPPDLKKPLPDGGDWYRSTTLGTLTPRGVYLQLQTLWGASVFLQLQSLRGAVVFINKL